MCQRVPSDSPTDSIFDNQPKKPKTENRKNPSAKATSKARNPKRKFKLIIYARTRSFFLWRSSGAEVRTKEGRDNAAVRSFFYSWLSKIESVGEPDGTRCHTQKHAQIQIYCLEIYKSDLDFITMSKDLDTQNCFCNEKGSLIVRSFFYSSFAAKQLQNRNSPYSTLRLALLSAARSPSTPQAIHRTSSGSRFHARSPGMPGADAPGIIWPLVRCLHAQNLDKIANFLASQFIMAYGMFNEYRHRLKLSKEKNCPNIFFSNAWNTTA